MDAAKQVGREGCALVGQPRSRVGYALLSLSVVLLAGLFVNQFQNTRAGEPPVPATVVPHEVTYCAPDGVPLKMDLYLPEAAAAGPVPAALFVHGGSWTSGDKRSAEGVLEINALVARGYLVASVNYRLAPEFIFPAPIEDVKCAVRYLRAHAATLHVDAQHIGAWGASAGGQLVSLLGLVGPSGGMEGSGGYADQSSQVQAVVDMYGRADLREVPATRPDLLPIFGGEANLARYSPVTYAGPDAPPFLILHGDQDMTVPPHLSREFAARLQAAGAPVRLVMVKNAGHGFGATAPGMTPSRAEITGLICDFFDQYLKGGVPAPPPAAAPAPPTADGGIRYTLRGTAVHTLFQTYWQQHGGLAQEGFPISGDLEESDPVDGRTYTVQYFERAVLEYHPENPAPFDVLPVLLGVQRYKALYPAGAPGQHPNPAPGAVLFPATGHRVGGGFLRYWQTHGGLMQQGYPISEEFTETSPLDGKPYTVQYFERAVFEDHPENNAANRVLLSQLGTFQYAARYKAGP